MAGDEPNPYAAPQYIGPPNETPDELDPEQIRRKHLEYETSLRSWGGLFVIIGVSGILTAVILPVEALVRLIFSQGQGGWQVGLTGLLLAAAIGGVGGSALIYVGVGLWQLRPRIRSTAMVLSALGLFLFPCGTIIFAHLLSLLLSRKGRMVLSSPYAEVRRQTPDIQYRTPAWNLVVVVAVVIALIFLIARFR